MASSPPMRSPKTWFYLVSGGGERAEEEHSARTELKKILHTILQQKLADREHVVFISARPGKLDPAVYSAHDLRQPEEEEEEGDLGDDEILMPGFERLNCRRFPPSSEARACDNAIVIFIGHGSNPKDWFVMPPSASPNDKDLGNFVFYKPNGEKIITPPRHILKNTLFISAACYSGNAFQKLQPRDDFLAVCTAGQDHPASFDPILGDTFAKFFSDGVWRQKTVTEFCEELQECYRSHQYIVKMKEENLHQSEEEYEMERREAAEWAGSDFIGYVPCQIPHDLWEVFREVEHLKRTVQADGIPETTKRLLMEHVAKLEHRRFDLMRMYKHKPNNRLSVWGAKKTVGAMTWEDFLHLPHEVLHSPTSLRSPTTPRSPTTLRSPTRFFEKVPTYVH